MDVEIQPCEASDVPRVLAIANWAAEHTTANFATEPERLEDWQKSWTETHTRHPWLVAKQNGEVVGFAKASPHRARGAYHWTAEVSVYVEPAKHGQGIGRALYTRLIPMLRAQGFLVLLAGITTPNPVSVKLHESFGFVRCGTFPKVGWKQGAWRDVGYWALELRAADPDPKPTRPVSGL